MKGQNSNSVQVLMLPPNDSNLSIFQKVTIAAACLFLRSKNGVCKVYFSWQCLVRNWELSGTDLYLDALSSFQLATLQFVFFFFLFKMNEGWAIISICVKKPSTVGQNWIIGIEHGDLLRISKNTMIRLKQTWTKCNA